MADQVASRAFEPSRQGAPPADAAIPAILVADLDDKTTAYAIAMRAPFEDLRQAAAQLAGLLVLAAAGSRAATPDHPMLAMAVHAHEGAADAIRGATAPERAAHHHRHLAQAALWVGRALAMARTGARLRGTLDVDAVMPLLREGWQELQWSAGALPGFEIVAFDQACCAHHARGGPTGGGA